MFYEIYNRHKREGELPCTCIKHVNLILCVTTTPYLPCNKNNITRKELYDFYYTLVTLTTGYKNLYLVLRYCDLYEGWSQSYSLIPSLFVHPDSRERCDRDSAPSTPKPHRHFRRGQSTQTMEALAMTRYIHYCLYTRCMY